jgi:hypothetical protein
MMLVAEAESRREEARQAGAAHDGSGTRVLRTRLHHRNWPRAWTGKALVSGGLALVHAGQRLVGERDAATSLGI